MYDDLLNRYDFFVKLIKYIMFIFYIMICLFCGELHANLYIIKHYKFGKFKDPISVMNLRPGPVSIP